MSDKIYVGSGKVVGKYGQIGVSLCVSDIPKEHIFTSQKTGKKYINLKVCEKKQVDQYGKTHYVEIDTWQPNQAPQQTGQPQTNQQNVQQTNFDVVDDSEVPF